MKKYSKLMAILLVFAMILAGVAQAAPVVEAEEVNSNVIRLSGADRIKTSVKISQTAYKDGAESVVIVGYEGEVDALAGTLLAHAKKGPVLFTKKGKLSEDTKTEIARLGAKNVYILGGTATIEDAVKTELETLKYTVKRISGSNREGTAAAVAKEVGGKTTHVFLARGYGDLRAVLSDALAVGPASAKGNMAVLLTRTDKVPAATLKSMKDLGVTNVTIVGGEVAVNSGVKTELETLKYTVDRLSGTTREGTAIAIANKYFAGKANALVANGYGSPDALVGGYLGAAIDAPILFSQANKVSEVTTDYLKANTEKAWILGGERVVNKEVLNKVLGAVVPTPTPPSTGGGSGGGSGDNVAVSAISVAGDDGATTITTDGGTLQMSADVSPDNASNESVTWSVLTVLDGGEETGYATIDENGVLTAVADGAVTVVATAQDGSGEVGKLEITISEQTGKVVNPNTVQNKIDYATEGTTIVLRPGDYGTLYLRQSELSKSVDVTDWAGDGDVERYREIKNLTIKGTEGANVDGIRLETGQLPPDNHSNEGHVNSYISISNLTLENIAFTGNNHAAVNLISNWGASSIDGLLIDGCTLTGKSLSEGEPGGNLLRADGIGPSKTIKEKTEEAKEVLTTGRKNLTIKNNIVSDTYIPVNITEWDNITFENNKFSNSGRNHILVTGPSEGTLNISGNILDTCPDRAIRLNAIKGTVNITGNTIKECDGRDNLELMKLDFDGDNRIINLSENSWNTKNDMTAMEGGNLVINGASAIKVEGSDVTVLYTALKALTTLNDELAKETLDTTAAMDALENEVLGLDLTEYNKLFIGPEDPAYTSGGTGKDRQKAVPGDLKGMMPDGGFETIESLQEALNASVEMRIAKRDAVIMVNSAETIQELDFATFYTRVINAYVNNPLLKDTKEYRTKGVETIAKYNNLSDASKEAVLTAVLEGGTGPNGNYLGHSQIYSLTNTQVDLAAAE